MPLRARAGGTPRRRRREPSGNGGGTGSGTGASWSAATVAERSGLSSSLRGHETTSSGGEERMEDDDMDLDSEDESELVRRHPLLAFLSSEFVRLDSSASALNASTSNCCTLRSELATAYLYYFCKVYRRECASVATEWMPKPGAVNWFALHATDALRKARSSLGIHLVFRMRRKWINGEFVYGRWCFGAEVDPVALVSHGDPNCQVSTRRQAAEQILKVCQEYVQEVQEAGYVPTTNAAGARIDATITDADLVNAWPSALAYENRSNMVLDTDADSQESSDFASSSASPSSSYDDDDSSNDEGNCAKNNSELVGDRGATGASASRSALRGSMNSHNSINNSNEDDDEYNNGITGNNNGTRYLNKTQQQQRKSSKVAAKLGGVVQGSMGMTSADAGEVGASSKHHRKRSRADMAGAGEVDMKRRRTCKELVWDGKRWRSSRRAHLRSGVKDERSRPLRGMVQSIFGMLQQADDEAVANEMMEASQGLAFASTYASNLGQHQQQQQQALQDRMGVWNSRPPLFPTGDGASASSNGNNGGGNTTSSNALRTGMRQVSSSSSTSNLSIVSAMTNTTNTTNTSMRSSTSSNASTASAGSASSHRSNQLSHQNQTNILGQQSSSSSSSGAGNNGIHHGTGGASTASDSVSGRHAPPVGGPLSSARSTTSTVSASSMTSAGTEDIAHGDFDNWLDRHHREFLVGKQERAPYEGRDYHRKSRVRPPPNDWDDSFGHLGQASMDYMLSGHAPWYKRDAYGRLDDRAPTNVEHVWAHAASFGAETSNNGTGISGAGMDEDLEMANETGIEKIWQRSNATVSMLASQGVAFTRALLKQMLYLRSLRSMRGNSEVLDILLLLVAAVRITPHFGVPLTFIDKLAAECVLTLEASGHEQLLADLLQRASSEGVLHCLAAVRRQKQNQMNPRERQELHANFTVVRDLLLHATG
mmetsp:Transcript_1667/g.3914  ORF Transcript_1667/g.3914 Transcript_1667/m.3914 type:complete len:939 (-) Transcript_1667:183-2999(-)|eukprot:CAMPEP_0171493392 /NCGR_PEP_ID=MMETSP0958-20121227/4937_1 /TAXON_ID=87120 /ORGANISM="Aurantiochytrium limacinum, Strain ATCCMYA-1381" /LENGTH=938 /DNA_ID=CAMNT_0012027011 /DNA_START=322 /DNA_END=3138 /DNA_ORIENTATION=+